MAYKIMKGIDRVDSQRFFPRMEMSITREHSFKMRGEKFKDDVKGKFHFNAENSSCLECAIRGGGGSRNNTDV